MATSPNSLTGSAADLGLGMGDLLGQQVVGETEEDRKKRLAAMSQQGAAAGSASVMQLFGGRAGGSPY